MTRFLLPREVAESMRKSETWVRKHLCEGGLVEGCVKLGKNGWRVPERGLEEWISAGCPGMRGEKSRSGAWLAERRGRRRGRSMAEL